MTKTSAGLLMYKKNNSKLEIFLIHPGGPFFKNRDDCWGIPKGLPDTEGEDLFVVAKREFKEETGLEVPDMAKFIDLGFITYPNGKQVFAWAFEQNLPENFILVSNPTPQGWPEIDKGEFFFMEIAKTKIFKPQLDLLLRLEKFA